MTPAQRTRINRQNAQKSTGPKTQEGKERARRNALKHGLCSSKLALPGEEPATLKEQHRNWIDTLQPQDPAEVTLVEEAVRASLRLKRCAVAENARQRADACRDAQRRREEREDQLADFIALLPTDPARATRQLKRCGHGCRWMLGRWRLIERAVARDGYAPPALVVEGIRLLGAQKDRPKEGPVLGFSFRFWNAVVSQHVNKSMFDWLCADEHAHAEHFALHSEEVPTPEQAGPQLLELVRAEIAALEAREREFAVLDALEDEEARANAGVPSDTPKTKLYLRYHAAATSAFHRALNTLSKLQKERLAAETEAAEREMRNEPEERSDPHVSDDEARDCGEEHDADFGDDEPRKSGPGCATQCEELPACFDRNPVVSVAPPVTALAGSV